MNDITYKKRKVTTEIIELKPQEFVRHNPQITVDFSIPIKLIDDENSFIEWYRTIRAILPLTVYKDLLNLNFINDDYRDYCSSLKPFNIKCSELHTLNRNLNKILIQSVDQPLINYLNLNPDILSYCNFEKIKIHFQAKLNIFYLMKLESSLTFDHNNKAKFLQDIEYLSNIYELIFNTVPSKDLKINWVINSLNKNDCSSVSNDELLLAVQANWDSVYNDPLSLRKLLLKY